MTLYTLEDVAPDIAPEAWIAPGVQIIGRVRLKAQASVWFGSILRGDNEWIELGERSNLQDGVVCHTDMGFPLTVGSDCTVGHRALLHGCTIGDNTLIGMNSMIMNGATVGRNCLIGAGSMITEGKEIPEGTLAFGSPAKVRRDLTKEEIAGLSTAAEGYVRNAARFRSGLKAEPSS